MIKFIIRCIKQALFGRYTIEPSYLKPGKRCYGLFEGTHCLATNDNKEALKIYLKEHIAHKKKSIDNNKIMYFDIDGNEL